MGRSRYSAWGYSPKIAQTAHQVNWRAELGHTLDLSCQGTMLPFGNGRSYGDSCLNSKGVVLDAGALDRFIDFNPETGVITAEAGVSLSRILSLVVPSGWFLPVSPGTSYVTLGGAIANDVHGKNHHCDGTIGRFVQQFELIRSSGECLICSAADNSELFKATIGGLGLTGFISTVTLQLVHIESDQMDVRIDAFHDLHEFTQLSTERMAKYQYTVAWLDCAATGDNFARGVFLSANHGNNGKLDAPPVSSKISIPINMPKWALNTFSIKAFNTVYFKNLARKHGQQISQPYQSYFYPLDAVGNWNRIYGAGGFYQYQFVVPVEALTMLDSILRDIVDSGMGSFLAVLKEFGDIPSPGMLSFPRKGYCLALDFANRGASTERLIKKLDAKVMECGGAAYPAKDRLMSAAAFKQYFPAVSEFEKHTDPNFSSDFWERVRG